MLPSEGTYILEKVFIKCGQEKLVAFTHTQTHTFFFFYLKCKKIIIIISQQLYVKILIY